MVLIFGPDCVHEKTMSHMKLFYKNITVIILRHDFILSHVTQHMVTMYLFLVCFLQMKPRANVCCCDNSLLRNYWAAASSFEK